MDPQQLSRQAREAFGLEVAFAAAREPADPGELSPAERLRRDDFALPRRREEWLRGRAALKQVLRALALPDDTSLMAFPHARVSLTHSAGLAVAAGLLLPDPQDPAALPVSATAGIGIDYEARRPVKPGSMRFFLSESERARLGTAPSGDGLLRLWTVKEALLKANPGNREGDGKYLARYVLEGSPEDLAGAARGPVPESRAFRYLSVAAWEGWLSLAVAVR